MNNIKVALVLPPAENVSEKKDTPTHQHVGLGYLASVLEKNGISVKIIDAKLDRMSFNDTVKAISSSGANVLGFTAMTHEINTAGKLAKRIKEEAPKTIIVIGGVHVTALPVETLKAYEAFDLGVLGEGEISFVELLRRIEKNNFDFSGIKGIVYRKDKEILLSHPAERIKDLDTLPFPAWHLFPNATEYIIITTRGCPFSCVFCMQAMGRQPRKRSALNVVEEMEKVILERKPRRFLFFDETFTLDKKHVYDICDLLIKKGISRVISWSATTRVDNIDRDILLKMKEAGCDHIEFGVESGNKDVLKRIRKGITLEQAERAVRLAKDLGLHNEIGFIIGHPNETLQTAYETLSFASKLNADIVQLGIMVPYPGTEVALMAREGRGGYNVISDNWSEYNKQLGNALEMENLSRKDLERLQLIGYLKLFVYNRRYLDLLRFIFNFRREMFAFLKNHFRKDKKSKPSRIGFTLMLRMIFSRSPVF